MACRNWECCDYAVFGGTCVGLGIGIIVLAGEQPLERLFLRELLINI